MMQTRDSNRVFFFDTTLRDGEQSPGCSMTVAEKVRMAHALDELGVDVIEAGFAVASDGDFEAISTVAHEIKRPVITSLARSRQQDIEASAKALQGAARPRIHVFLGSSDLHLQFKLKLTREQALEQVGASVRLARTLVDDVEFSPEDASRAEPAFLARMVAVAIEAGATVINLPDTVGYSLPAEYGQMFRRLRDEVPGVRDITLSSHCHNDLGLAVANTMAAIDAGVRQVECTINGIGERAGNAALEEIAAVLQVRRDAFPVEHSLKMDQLFPTSQILSQLISFGPSPNKAVVGSNAFAHEAGIHQHGMLSNPLTYEIMTPASVGVPATTMVLGKHSGRHALASRLQQLGFQLSALDLDQTYRRFTELADRKKAVYDQDLVALVNEHHDVQPIRHLQQA